VIKAWIKILFSIISIQESVYFPGESYNGETWWTRGCTDLPCLLIQLPTTVATGGKLVFLFYVLDHVYW